MVASGWREGEMGRCGSRGTKFQGCKIDKFWRALMCSVVTIVDNCVQLKFAKTAGLKCSHLTQITEMMSMLTRLIRAIMSQCLYIETVKLYTLHIQYLLVNYTPIKMKKKPSKGPHPVNKPSRFQDLNQPRCSADSPYSQ